MTTIVDIATAVVTELNGHTFSQAFVAARMYLPVFDLAEMDTLHVTVVPKGFDRQAVDRASAQSDYSVDVAVQKKVASPESANMDPLMALVEEIARFFQGRRLASLPAIWSRTENLPIYSPEHLGQLNQFTSVLTLTFRVVE